MSYLRYLCQGWDKTECVVGVVATVAEQHLLLGVALATVLKKSA